MSEWKLVEFVTDGQPLRINDVNVWDHDWLTLGNDPIMVPHPDDPDQSYKMWPYQINTKNKKIIFASGEISHSVWGFYIPA